MPVPHVQTKREIQDLLTSVGLRPRKRFGQHFLIDGNLMRRLVDAAGIEPDDVILEVGPGTGGLTDLLAKRTERCICVEVDRDLQELLARRFVSTPSVQLVRGDILAGKHRLAEEVASLLAPCETVKLVANLPYQVATPLIMNLLVDYPQVKRLCFTVQAEVGQRMTASPGGKTYGPLAIMSQLLTRVETTAKLPPAVFWPQPTVDSVMLRMDLAETPFADRESIHGFASMVRSVFEHRRKTLRSALGYVVDDTTRDRVCDTLDGSRRPEAIDTDEWLAIYEVVRPT